MRANPDTPVLLRRIAQLEATVVRLSEDLGSLRLAVREQGLQVPGQRAARTRPAHGPALTGVRRHTHPPSGLAGALARGEAARVQWVQDGVVIPGERLAQAWGLTRQALAPAAARGEIFAVKIGNRLYYPRAFLGLERQAVAIVCHALGDIGASEKLMFWLREHGVLGGKSVGAALEAGMPLARVERLAVAWARERGATRVAAAA